VLGRYQAGSSKKQKFVAGLLMFSLSIAFSPIEFLLRICGHHIHDSGRKNFKRNLRAPGSMGKYR
jgi:hypothetical protein